MCRDSHTKVITYYIFTSAHWRLRTSNDHEKFTMIYHINYRGIIKRAMHMHHLKYCFIFVFIDIFVDKNQKKKKDELAPAVVIKMLQDG